MNVLEMKCKSCGGKSFVQAMDFINLRQVDKEMTFGSDRILRFVWIAEKLFQ
ncbi:hypothetical protein ACOI1C_07525 [Bacillus sp. DJP31]|uniref:hypothetical protein n=1 Tax=Bacillus sp. DJP31 TaxID=3409789 RepID=UPI003BB5985F